MAQESMEAIKQEVIELNYQSNHFHHGERSR